MLLGAHIGIADGLPEAAVAGRAIGCESIQIFAKSPQMWAGPPIPPAVAEAFRTAVTDSGLRATAVHHGYLINLASPKRPMLERSRRAFLDEIRRAELLGVDGLIFHPGAHLGSGPEAGRATIAESLRRALDAVPEGRVRLLLEISAGQGTAMCSTFEELADVIARVNAPDRLGVTVDTCHLFCSGVDFRSDEDYARLLDRIAATIGLDAVRAFHLNDTKAPLGSHLDRHENIGKGQLGLDGFRHLVNDPGWAEVPGYLETPLDAHDYQRYVEDLQTLRSLVRGPGTARGRARPVARRSRRASS